MARLLTSTLPRLILLTMTGPDARRAYLEFRRANGRLSAPPLLTAPDGNAKLGKADVPTYGLSLAPASASGHNVCPKSTPECRRGCVSFAGRGMLRGVAAGRAIKTQFFAENPAAFVALLADEIRAAVARHDGPIAVRLNTFSDIPWHTLIPWLFEMFPDVTFYDYTKVWTRADENLPANWHLTYSASERTSDAEIAAYVAAGRNVAVVFKGKTLPAAHGNVAVVDGNVTDARWLDPVGVVVGLNAKGRMRKGDWKMARTA